MYVSPAVRSLCADPVPDERVRLVLEPAADADPDAVAAAARAAGATVEDRLQFGDLLVSVAHEGIGDVCDLDGLAAVQTDNAVGISPAEAEEDATFEP